MSDAPINIMSIPITKAGKNANLTVDVSLLSEEMYALCLAEGLKSILNSRMSKVGPVTKYEKEGNTEELAKANATAMKIAEENLNNLMTGEIKAKAKKSASGLDRSVLTEARRIARDIVKNQIRAAGGKPSHYPASEITKAADAFIASDPSIVEDAKAALAKRSENKPSVDISTLIKESPTLVAKAKAKSEANKAPGLSAKQAGMVPTRKKAPAHATIQ